MGDDTGQPAEILHPIWRGDRLCCDEERGIGQVERFWVRHVCRSDKRERGVAERSSHAGRKVNLFI